MQFTDVLPVFCKYVVPGLKFGLEKFSVEDVFRIEQLARSSLPTVSDRNLLDLVEECDRFMEKHLPQLMITQTFLEHAHGSFLEEFLSRNDIADDPKVETQVSYSL